MNLKGKGLTNQYNKLCIFKGKKLYFEKEPKISCKSLVPSLDTFLRA